MMLHGSRGAVRPNPWDDVDEKKKSRSGCHGQTRAREPPQRSAVLELQTDRHGFWGCERQCRLRLELGRCWQARFGNGGLFPCGPRRIRELTD